MSEAMIRHAERFIRESERQRKQATQERERLREMFRNVTYTLIKKRSRPPTLPEIDKGQVYEILLPTGHLHKKTLKQIYKHFPTLAFTLSNLWIGESHTVKVNNYIYRRIK